MTNAKLAALAAGVLWIAIGGSSALAQLQGGPKAKLSLVPATTGVVPGEPFEIGIHFELQEDWHIYWKNSGDSGLPPVFKWDLPPGFHAAEPQFPLPTRHYSPGDIVTNILGGDPMFLVEITPPASFEEGTVRLAADVRYLICKENCIREDARVSLELPVLPASAKADPDNERIFRRARRALPKKVSESLTAKPVLSPSTLKPGAEFELELQVSIKRGLHIQSNKPLLESLVAADVFLEPVEFIEFGTGIYPAPKKRKVEFLGELTEFGGNFTIRIPGKLASDAKSIPEQIAGVFVFQACSEQGNCLPPEGVSFSVKPSPATAKGSTMAAPDSIVPPGSDTTKELAAPVASVAEQPAMDQFFKKFGLIGLLAACFLYGLFINATPCVLPLLSIKVLGFVQQAHQSRKRTALLGLAFGAGVILFFVLLGLLASRGQNVLQFPVAVIVLGAIVLALALSMLGVYTLQVPTAATSLEARIHSEGILASFGKGALAPVLGFACTGPLLAGAWGWAVKQPSETAVLAFLFAGLGMASPYMLLGANPRWLSFLPRPGNWMITFERIMGFFLLAMVIWLIHPLTVQIGVGGLEWTLVFYVAVAVGCWLLGKVQVTMGDLQRWRFRGAAATIIVLAAGVIYGVIYPLGPAAEQAEAERLAQFSRPASADHIAWRLWTPESVEETVRNGNLAFVDFTAAYCTVCKVNKGRAIDTPPTRARFSELGVVAFQGDFTNGDPDIDDLLKRYDRAGVPLNLIYTPGRPNDPIVLSPNLSQSYLLEKIDEAARTKTASASVFRGVP